MNFCMLYRMAIIMKKLLCICLCFMFLAGCAKKNDVKTEPLTLSGFDAVITTDLNGITLSSNVSYDFAGGYKFSFNSPETLKNLTVSGKDGEFTLTGEKLTLNLQSDKLPESMICRALSDCVDAVSGAYPIKNSNGLSEYAYSVDKVPCVLYTDEDKNFKKLIVGAQEFIFESFSYSR